MRPEKNDKPLECELYIVHDKDTKPLAVGLYNKLASVCKCAHWDEKHYYDNEYRATNKNRFLFLSDKLITENLLPGLTTEEKILDNVVLINSGNMYGLKADTSSALTIKLKDWRNIMTLLSGFVGAPFVWVYFKHDEKKRTRFKLLFDGVKYLTEDDHYKLIIKD